MDHDVGDNEGSFVYFVLALATIGAALFIIRKYIKGGQFNERASAKGKVFVITGANSGIGFETARHLNLAKGKVYLLCRDDKKGEQAKIDLVKCGCDASRLVYEQCDLTNFESIRECAKNILKAENVIDVLINNAGIMFYPKFELTVDKHETTWQSNYLGPFLLTELLLPAIIKAPSGRVINVSSKLHKNSKKIDLSVLAKIDDKKSYGFLEPYNRSKLANVMHARALTRKLQRDGIHNVTVNSLHPGVINSNLSRHTILGKKIVQNIGRPFAWFFTKTCRDGAQTSIFLALSAKVDQISGKYFADCALTSESHLARDDQACEDLYNYSLEQVGLAK